MPAQQDKAACGEFVTQIQVLMLQPETDLWFSAGQLARHACDETGFAGDPVRKADHVFKGQPSYDSILR